MNYTYAELAKMIDHSLLNPTLTAAELEAGCKLALAYDTASVCILPYYLRRCAEILRGSTVMASTTNQIAITGPNILPTLSVPRLWMANRPRRGALPSRRMTGRRRTTVRLDF